MRLVRIGLLLVIVALVGPGAMGAYATVAPSHTLTFRSVSAAPAEINVANIQFALERGNNNQPIAPDTRFKYGVRKVWAFWSWDNSKPGGRVKYVLRSGETDMAWGELVADERSGRMEIELERQDGGILSMGQYRLYLDAYDNASGDVRQATFDIFDDRVHHDDNGNHNDNHDDNGNNNSNNNTNGNNNSNDNHNNNDNSDHDNEDNDND